VTTGLARAGARVATVAEANGTLGWLRDPLGAVSAPGKAAEAARYAAVLARHHIPYRTRTVVREILGDGRAEAVRIATVDGRGHPAGPGREIPVDLVALGWGFTPSLELPLMLGTRTRQDTDGSLVVVVDARQRSSVPGVYVAGEATGVGGAALAVAEGRLSALALADDLGPRPPVRQGAAADGALFADAAATPDGLRAAIRREQARVRRGRRFAAAMHRAYPVPAAWAEDLPDTTLVCRCEEVTCGDLRRAHTDLGATDPRTLKMLTRPGMGWCQGRICGFATAGISACLNGRPLAADDLRPLSGRTPAVPVTLAEVAAAGEDPDSGPA
jgi:D-hydroxyproline dehydrogenase subunit alpha